jgi:ankyrin repeat protein
LLAAIKADDITATKLAIDAGANVSSILDEHGSPPLHLAAVGGNLKMMELLVLHGADVNAGANNGSAVVQFYEEGALHCTALHYAAGNGHLKAVRWLVQHGADVNATDKMGSTALHFSAIHDRWQSISLLVELGADQSLENCSGQTALEEATEHENVQACKILLALGLQAAPALALKRAQKKLNAVEFQCTACAGTGICGKKEYKAAPSDAEDKEDKEDDGREREETKDDADEQKLVLRDVKCKRCKGTGELAEANAEAKRAELKRQSALYDAINAKDLAAMERAVAEGASVSNTLHSVKTFVCTNERQINALQLAAKNGQLVLVKWLVEHGAGVMSADQDGITSIHYAIANGHVAVIEWLLEHGADAKKETRGGRAAIHFAADICKLDKGHWSNNKEWMDMVRLLLKHGADVLAQDNDGRSALHIVAISGHLAMMTLMLESGADVAAKVGVCVQASRSHPLSHFLILSHPLSPSLSPRLSHPFTYAGHQWQNGS